jgi:F0F1-type ATP synthase assembly protein I
MKKEEQKLERKKMKSNNNSFANQVIWGGGIVSLVFMLFAFFTAEPLSFVLGVLVGGICSIVSFKILQITCEKAMKMPSGQVPGYLQTRYFLRYLGTGVIIYIAVINPWLNIVGVLLGLIATKVSIYIVEFFSKKNASVKEA